MGHTRAEDLKDLRTELNQIRALAGLKEKAPNIFYFKSKPFLHFHDKDGKRWADVKDGADWGEPIEIPFAADSKLKAGFMKEVIRRYREVSR